MAGSFRCVFADGPATSAVTVAATDSDGATGPADSREVTVDDVAPTVTLDAGNALSVQESRGGHLYRYELSDPGDDTIASVQTSCGTAGVKVPDSDRNTTIPAAACAASSPAGRRAPTCRCGRPTATGAAGTADVQTVTSAIPRSPPRVSRSTASSRRRPAVASRSSPTRRRTPPPTSTRASIDWGDGSAQNAGTIRKLDDGTFVVEGSHAYRRFGTYDVDVRIADADNPANGDSARSTARIADAPIRAAAASITTPLTLAGRVATFADEAEPDGSAADFSAVIDWGDGSAHSAGTISGPGRGRPLRRRRFARLRRDRPLHADACT